jgi:hypothetical protein
VETETLLPRLHGKEVDRPLCAVLVLQRHLSTQNLGQPLAGRSTWLYLEEKYQKKHIVKGN